MKKLLLASIAGLLLALPVACMHPGYHGGQGGPGCPKQQGCGCKCRQQPDCPSKPDCPQNRQQEPAAPAK